MAAPMTPASPYRSPEIVAKENAIKKRLEASNSKNRIKARSDLTKQIMTMKKKHQRGSVTKSYTTQSILGADKGFSKSDYGVGDGAAIPYQIGTKKENLSGSTGIPPKPKPRNTPEWVTSMASSARKKAISNRLTSKGR